MSDESLESGICGRIAEIRRELHGDRGKAAFAQQLGVSPSTYNYYEAGRVPPAALLVKIADVAGADLRWLLTGELSPVPVAADHPAVRRIAALLADHPEAAGPLAAFVDLLAASLSWPAKPAAKAAAAPGVAVPVAVPAIAAAGADRAASAPLPPVSTGDPQQGWIPILGRSAAGVPRFWSDAEEGAGTTLLSDLVGRYARRARRRVTPAVAGRTDDGGEAPAQIVTLAEPDGQNVAEFVVADTIKRRYPDAFAIRIDGDSMSPEIRHGDVIVCSPAQPAADGRPAVVQLRGQIGVTCKLYRRDGDNVHLVPVNEHYAPQAFPAEQVVWALRVLARISSG